MLNERYLGKITPEFFAKIQDSFKLYKEHKQPYNRRIIENNRWFKSRYEDDTYDEMPRPTTPYLFNAIANKHADIMDNYPEPNILERKEKDRPIADTLTKILPLQLDLCDFKQTYSRAWWYKLKNGAACYGIFFNPLKNNGIGDIDIKRIDLLNLFWEPGITDIQESKFVFLTALVDNDLMKEKYPQYADQFTGNGNMEIQSYDDAMNTLQADLLREKTLVIDCYYKKNKDGRQTVEMLKYTDNLILDASEDRSSTGLYDHGKYPFVFDVMYPDEDSPVGFGLVDVIKNPQLYIDRLDALISQNAMISGKSRFMIRDNGGLNEYELTDISKDIIHVAGAVSDENIRELQTKPLHPFIIQHRQNKIAELKEIAGNRDFQQGDTRGGVTAYSAIAALQQAGEKLSRDMINESYTAYKEIVYFCIELIKQFYDTPHTYRISGEEGETEYISLTRRDFFNGTSNTDVRPAEFDIAVSAEKNNPFSRATQNQTLLDLWKMGVFAPETKDRAKILLECIHLDGKEKLLEGLDKLIPPVSEEQQQKKEPELPAPDSEME